MKKTISISVAFIIFLWLGCTYKKEVTDAPLVSPLVACDTTNVKYSVQIVAILSANCYRCHSAPANAGGGIVLNDYNSLKIWATSGTLYNVVNYSPGADFMPKGAAKLVDCDIAKIRTWVRNGSLNN